MRWIEATRNFDQKKKKAVYGIFFFFNPDEIWKKKSLIFFPPSRFLQRVGTRSRFVASRPLFAHWGCRLLLQGPLALVMSGPIRMKMEDKEFRLQLFLISNFLHCRKYDGMVRRAVEIRSLIFFLFSLSCRVKAGQIIIDSGQISFTSSCLLICSDWWPGLCFRLTSHPFSPSRSSRTHTRQDWRGNCCCCC